MGTEKKTTRVAAVTDDGKTISAHFGRARYYLVCTIEAGGVVSQELREKTGHHTFASSSHHDEHHAHGHGMGPHAASRHATMLEPLADCEVLLARGMGRGAYSALKEAGIKPVVTDEENIADGVKAYVEGTIVDHYERLH
jgi:predicted Fe-Mo cluster-binding NifX family protein